MTEPPYSVYKHFPVGQDIWIEYFDELQWAEEYVKALNEKKGDKTTYYYVKHNHYEWSPEINYK
jgi:hypothetical protein